MNHKKELLRGLSVDGSIRASYGFICVLFYSGEAHEATRAAL